MTPGRHDRSPSAAAPSELHGPPLALPRAAVHPLGEVLVRAAASAPDAGVLVAAPSGSGSLVPYPALLDDARRLARGLRASGCLPGDTAALYGLDLEDLFPCFWACQFAGLVPLAVAAGGEQDGSSAPSGPRLVQAIDLLDRTWVIADRSGRARLEEVGLGEDVPVLSMRGLRSSGGRTAAAESAPARAPRATAPALLMLSSGSTGRAKVAPLTHEGLQEFLAGSPQALGWRAGEVTLNWLPVDHSASLLLYHLLPAHLGSTNVHALTSDVLADPLLWLDLIQAHSVRHTWAPTFGYRLAHRALDTSPGRRWDLSTVRTFVSGGEQILPSVVDGFFAAVRAFGATADTFVAGWGMAETCTGIVWSRYAEPGAVQHVSPPRPYERVQHLAVGARDALALAAVGRPAPGAAVRVVDAQGRALAEGTVGNLQVRSRRVTPGYLGDDEANARAFPGGRAGASNWFDTGDLAFVSDGRLVVTGRSKHMVVINGENHACESIERVVGAVGGVSDVAVAAFAVPDPATGTEALAVVLAGADGNEPDAGCLHAARAALLAELGLVARHVVGIADRAMPRTSSGKVRRDALPALLPAATTRRLSGATAGASDATATVRRALAEVLGTGIDDDGNQDRVPFFELGLTSVMTARLRLRLSADGFDVSSAALFEHPTVHALAQHLGALVRTDRPDVGTSPRHAPGIDPVAVVAVSLRFPGADTMEQYWDLLWAGRQAIKPVTRTQQRKAGLTPEQRADPGRRTSLGWLDGAHLFDPGCFAMTPAEAALTHPGHRLFLECAHEALEVSGYLHRDDAVVGVFAGSGNHLLDHQVGGRTTRDEGPAAAMQAALGSAPDFLASRAAYRLGLTGPAISVQTACSTSLVAVHLAVRALQNGDADLALAGAAAVHVLQDAGYLNDAGSVLSPSGTCRPFDARADGTVGGSGVAVVLLKRLSQAQADGDPVLGVIAGTAVNNDGRRKVGFAAPSVAGQVEVVRSALRSAGVAGEDLVYVEAHGTGTPLGDPLEFEALSRALDDPAGRAGRCYVGSVKGNIGHLDSCAGMAGLLKAMLVLQHGTMLPSGGLDTPNPELRTDGPLTLATGPLPLPRADGDVPLRAGVNALGVGGTNAFVVLEEPPARPSARPGQDPVLVSFTGRDEQAVRDFARVVGAWLRDNPDTAPCDVAATLAGRHQADAPAVAIAVARTSREMSELLSGYGQGAPIAPGRALRANVARAEIGPAEVAVAFSGQGTSYRGMAKELHEASPVVRDVLQECERVHEAEFGQSLLAALLTGRPGEPIDALLVQPALFSYQAALLAHWTAQGLRPAVVLGHSLGEFAALHAAGALSLRDGVRLTGRRGRVMAAVPVLGGMLATRLDDVACTRLLAETGLELGVRNGHDRVVLTGATHDLQRAERLLEASGVPARRLVVPQAFHSSLLDPVLDRLAQQALGVELAPLALPLVVGRDGTLLPAGSRLGPRHVVDHARHPVRFDRQVHALAGSDASAVLELGPGGELTQLGRLAAPRLHWVASLSKGLDPGTSTMLAVGELHCAGVPIPLPQATGTRRLLPGTPFRHRDFRQSDLSRFGGMQSGESVTPAEPGRNVPDLPLPEPNPGPQPASHERDGTNRRGDAQAMSEDHLDQVRAVTARCLGLTVQEVDADCAFVSMGGESLPLLAVTRELERVHGVRVPVRELYEASDTPRKLAAALRAGSPGAEENAPAAPGRPEPEVQRPLAPEAPAETGRARPATTTPQDEPALPGGDLAGVLQSQLAVLERLIGEVTDTLNRQVDALAGAASEGRRRPGRPGRLAQAAAPAQPTPAPPGAAAASPAEGEGPGPRPTDRARPVRARPPTARRSAPGDYSLYFFGDYPADGPQDRYRHVLRAAEWADQAGLHAIWLPERHFHSFGGLFPNPSVLAAALAVRTSRIRLHAGSVVLPLHHPVRVAEEWSMVDNLSGGRAGICFASGWHANDFALAPANYGRHKELMYEQLADVRALLAGDRVTLTSGTGEPVDVSLFPRPTGRPLPLFTAVVENPDSYRRAAQNDLGVVTNLMTQSVPQLAENIALYRSARAAAGLDPDAGRVVVLMHTYMGEDLETVREQAAAPFADYLRSSLSLLDRVANSLGLDADMEDTTPEDLEFLLDRAYGAYCHSRALIGTVDSCAPVARAVREAGADEIACFVDFGVEPELLQGALPFIASLADRDRSVAPARTDQGGRAADDHARPAPAAPPPGAAPLPDGHAPVTAAQRRLWVLDQMYPDQADYLEPKAVLLTGVLDLAALRGALRRVVERHPQLRSVFANADGEPVRRVVLASDLPCPVVALPGADVDEAVARLLERDGRMPMDLSSGPLLRLQLASLAEDRHVLLLMVHHIVFDSFSTRVFCSDLGAYYAAWPHAPDLPDLPAAPDLPAPHDRDGHAPGLAFWKRELHDAPALRLPADHPPAHAGHGIGAHVVHDFEDGVAAGLAAFSRAEAVTPFTVLLAALAVALGTWAGQDDVVVGAAVTNRPEEAENAVGMFVDVVPLRLRLGADQSFTTFLRSVRSSSTDAYSHQYVPFDDLVDALRPTRVPGQNPLFRVLVEYERIEQLDFAPHGLTAEVLDVPTDRAPFDLTFYLAAHPGGLRCTVEYRADLYEEATVRRLLRHVEAVLRRAPLEPGTTLSRLAGLAPATAPAHADGQGPRRNEARAPSAIPATLHDLVAEQARANPDRAAVLHAGSAISYRELDTASQRLAGVLVGLGIRPGAVVALGLSRGPDLVRAMLAVMRAGAAYLPLDLGQPGARLEQQVEDSGAACLLVDDLFLQAHPRLNVACPVRHVDAAGPEAGLPPADDPDAIAYCIYTSGSSGRPKAVRVPHRGPVNLVRWHQRVNRPLRTAQWTSACFDVSVQEIFTTLASGAELVVVPHESWKDPAALAELLDDSAVERLHLPCTVLKHLIAQGTRLPRLRELCVAGEQLVMTPVLRRFLQDHPELRLYNQYGPTEASVIVTSHEVLDQDDGPVPIGRAIDNVRLFVLDAHHRQVPTGSTGQLHIGGEAVAAGYLHDAGATERAFVTVTELPGERLYRTGDRVRDRGDGTFEFHGRLDDQVKIRGHRVEPGEVRAAVSALPGVADVAVVSLRDAEGDNYLAAYVVPDGHVNEQGLDVRLRAELRTTLPEHLVPERWSVVRELPVGPTGKLSLQALPAPPAAPAAPAKPDGATPVGPGPVSGVPELLTDLWSRELSIESVPPDVSFFELGGNSLRAVRLLTRVRATFGVQYPMSDFVRDPTLRALGAALGARANGAAP